MELKITGRNIEITDGIKEALESELHHLAKYSTKEIEAEAVIKTYNYGQKIELTVDIDKCHVLRQEVTDPDLYRAINIAVDKLEHQMRKIKDRLSGYNHHRESKPELFDFFLEMEGAAQESTKIERRKILDLKPMTEEEAILQFELVGHDFYIFEDAQTTDVKVLYKRKNGTYGILEADN